MHEDRRRRSAPPRSSAPGTSAPASCTSEGRENGSPAPVCTITAMPLSSAASKKKSLDADMGIEPVVLRLQLECAETIHFAAAPDFVPKLALAADTDPGRPRPSSGPGVRRHRASDQIVLAPMVLHYRERDRHRPVHPVRVHDPQQIVRRGRTPAVPRAAQVRVGVEDAEAVSSWQRTPGLRPSFRVVDRRPPMSRVRALAVLEDRAHGGSNRLPPPAAAPSQSSIIAAERIVATGLAMPWPAMSGADPWDGWKTAYRSPMSAEGAMPMPPTRPASRSERMSPNMFSVTITSKRSGRVHQVERGGVDIDALGGHVAEIRPRPRRRSCGRTPSRAARWLCRPGSGASSRRDRLTEGRPNHALGAGARDPQRILHATRRRVRRAHSRSRTVPPCFPGPAEYRCSRPRGRAAANRPGETGRSGAARSTDRAAPASRAAASSRSPLGQRTPGSPIAPSRIASNSRKPVEDARRQEDRRRAGIRPLRPESSSYTSGGATACEHAHSRPPPPPPARCRRPGSSAIRYAFMRR